ncbi:MAG: thioredoxin [Planctomycetaceae bacterium]
MSPVKHVTLQSFQADVLQSPVPVLVDFYADWCGPCRILAPTMERLSEEFAGRASVVKINIDQEPELANQFQVQSIPTLIFVAGGNVVARTSGVAAEASLRNALHQLTANSATIARRVG